MTRVPKFRAWDKTVDEMVDVDEMQWTPNKNGVMEFFGIGNFIPCGLLAREVEIMESTGLKDKNGIEIYENDILKLDGLVGLFEVRRANSGLYKLFRRSTPLDLIKLIDWIGYVEVVGNVYENKELVE